MYVCEICITKIFTLNVLCVTNDNSICAGTNSSLHLTIDPRRPSGVPEFKFLGPEHGNFLMFMVDTCTCWDVRDYLRPVHKLF